MKINPFIFRGYDIRGLVNEDLGPEVVGHIGKAFGTYLSKRGVKKAIVGHDSRFTGPEYSRIMMESLNWAGIDVIDIDMELIGTFYWSQYYLNCSGGVYVTGSHNPAEYNGFKLANNFSETLVSEGIQELREITEKEDYKEGSSRGNIEKKSVREAYFSDILNRLPLKKKFKIVVDPSCSTAGIIAPDLLRRAGCEVIENNCEIDSSFPMGVPDPSGLPVATRLKEKVLKEGADIGFSYDADGDRIGIVDDKGDIIWNDVLLALFAMDVLEAHPGATIMYNTLCSRIVEDTILKYGGKPFMWRVGHSFLKKKNQEIKAAFIGELSGHFFFSADFYNHDDGLYSTMRLLGYLSRINKPLSEIISSLPRYVSSPEIKLYCADDKKVEFINKITPILRKDFSNAEIINDERAGDGVRVNLSDGMFVLRYSQNAPYLTIKFEGETEERYNYLKNYIKKLLHNYEEVDWKSDINLNLEVFD